MTSFRFNFSSQDSSNNLVETAVMESRAIKWLESEEVLPEKQLNDIGDEKIRAKMFVSGNVEIGHVVGKTALANAERSSFTNAIKLAENVHSDLIAGTYEGGLKIWECTYDMVEFLEKQAGINFENKSVLDLGCGAGILGIYSFSKGSRVTFQDYNKEVLEYITIPNLLLNIEEDKENQLKKCKFYSGDWESFNKKLPKSYVYDIILTSETIYNESNFDKLISIFIERLSNPGVAYVAAKTYYFGVGGGIQQFEQAIQKNGHLKCEFIWKSIEEGIHRQILKITHNKS